MDRAQHLSPSRLLLRDTSVTGLLLNSERQRMLARFTGLSGLSPGESWLVTFLALGAAAHVLENALPHIPAPSRGDLVMSGSTVGEMIRGIGGGPGRAVPGYAGLVVLALFWKYHPLARGSARLARGSAHISAATERRLHAYYRQLSRTLDQVTDAG